MIKKQKMNTQTSERTILITCTMIVLFMSVTTFGFLAFWYLFFPLSIINALVLLNKLRISSLTRTLILINIIVAVAAIYFIVGRYAGWLLV